MTTLFISDLHLSAARPDIIGLFLRFLAERASAAATLYILGDLFEYWIGDDAADTPEYRDTVRGLARATGGGLPIHVMRGNRDFLLDADFARASGCRLLRDPSKIDLYGRDVLLMHGDSLCTDDVAHQAFRQQVICNAAWHHNFLAKSLAEREAIARGLRRQSETAKAEKTLAIMDVNPDAVAAAMRAQSVTHLIHGHTHRPGDHRFTLDGAPARRTVLGAWYEQGSVLVCTPDDWRLEDLPLPEASVHAQRGTS